MSCNDSGTTPAETVVAMAISGMLFASVIGVMFLSVKLVRTAPPDTNPHTFGALATSVARLEGSLVAPLACENSPGENSRRGCLKVVVGPAAPQAQDLRDAIDALAVAAGLTTDLIDAAEGG